MGLVSVPAGSKARNVRIAVIFETPCAFVALRYATRRPNSATEMVDNQCDPVVDRFGEAASSPSLYVRTRPLQKSPGSHRQHQIGHQSSTVIAASGPSASAEVQLAFTGTTWLEARSGPTGTVLYVGTVSAGATEALQTPVWIRFGNSVAAQATVNGAALQIPAGLGDLEVTAG